ncbi:hypothetical protein ACFYV7_19665 [Nocardia suismassiliense]|uniref:Secreted protein n=1 Tax=Nocardia suismassiliense TaxID=2077092 RepID=A0ABW6QWP6_9NOCA
MSTIVPTDLRHGTNVWEGNTMRNLLCLLVMSGAFSIVGAGSAAAESNVSRAECENNGGEVVPGAMTPGFCSGGTYDTWPIDPSDHSF